MNWPARIPSPAWRRVVALAVAYVSLGTATALGSVLGDVVLNRQSTANGVPAVRFPHWKHRSLFRCYACHPQPFEMKAGANRITMDEIRAGEFCGRCHNGTIAFAAGFDTCRECHSHVE